MPKMDTSFDKVVLRACPLLTLFVWRAYRGGEIRWQLEKGDWTMEVLAEPLAVRDRAEWDNVFRYLV